MKKMNFPSKAKASKKFEINNKSVCSQCFFFVKNNEKEIKHTHKSKHNVMRKHKTVLLIITDDKNSIILQ